MWAGVSHISVHGRTRHQASTQPVDISGIRFAVECARGRVPIVASACPIPMYKFRARTDIFSPCSFLPHLSIADGDVWSRHDAEFIRGATGVRGVMSARGLLANPVCPSIHMLVISTGVTSPFQALFAGYDAAPTRAIHVRAQGYFLCENDPLIEGICSIRTS
jgi:tRNA-dihydrouridine synthase 4